MATPVVDPPTASVWPNGAGTVRVELHSQTEYWYATLKRYKVYATPVQGYGIAYLTETKVEADGSEGPDYRKLERNENYFIVSVYCDNGTWDPGELPYGDTNITVIFGNGMPIKDGSGRLLRYSRDGSGAILRLATV